MLEQVSLSDPGITRDHEGTASPLCGSFESGLEVPDDFIAAKKLVRGLTRDQRRRQCLREPFISSLRPGLGDESKSTPVDRLDETLTITVVTEGLAHLANRSRE